VPVQILRRGTLWTTVAQRVFTCGTSGSTDRVRDVLYVATNMLKLCRNVASAVISGHGVYVSVVAETEWFVCDDR